MKVTIIPNIKNETSTLELVLLGIADSFGGTPSLEEAYDPKSKEHILAGTFPLESDLVPEIESFAQVLKKHDVEVLRPTNIQDCNQIFARDISFTIEDKLIIANMISDRAEEQKAIDHILSQIADGHVVHMPEQARAEGGDVMPWNDHVFIGYEEKEDFEKYKTSRTNRAGVEFIQSLFPEKKVMGFELNKSDTIARDNALHLDCCFQPIGKDKCIIHRDGFKNEKDFQYLVHLFGEDNCIFIDKDQMYNMGSNVFSISPNVVVSERGFTEINAKMRNWGFTVEEIKYSETAKMEGLLRCSTMPIIRKND